MRTGWPTSGIIGRPAHGRPSPGSWLACATARPGPPGPRIALALVCRPACERPIVDADDRAAVVLRGRFSLARQHLHTAGLRRPPGQRRHMRAPSKQRPFGALLLGQISLRVYLALEPLQEFVPGRPRARCLVTGIRPRLQGAHSSRQLPVPIYHSADNKRCSYTVSITRFLDNRR